MQLRPDSPIAVVGGSLTGPALALALQSAGFTEVNVFESMPQTLAQAGGVIGLEHPSLDALDALGIDQDEVVPFSSERVISIKVLDRRGDRRVRTLWPGRNTTWSVLHAALKRRLPTGTFHGSKRFVGFGPDGGLRFADGDEVDVEFVAFADGRRSTGRGVLDPQRLLRYAGYVAHRGQVEYEPGSDELDFVRYEPGRSQFNVFPVQLGNGRIGLDWTFYLPLAEEAFVGWFGDVPTVRTFILDRQVNESVRLSVDEAAERLLPERQASMVHRTTARSALPVLDITSPTCMVSQVGQTTAVLVGDALAPVRPHTARGANNGIEEAVGLAVALRQHARYGADLRTALRGWQARFLPIVENGIRRGPELGANLGLGL